MSFGGPIRHTTMTDEARVREDITGSLRAEDGQGIVRIEARLGAAVHDVWSAIADADRLAGWYGEAAGDLRPGGEFRLHVPVSGWTGTGRVVECDAPHRLVVTTRESDESSQAGVGAKPFDKSLDATLRGDAGQTVLTLEVVGVPVDAIAFFGAGWQLHVEALADYVAGRETRADETRFDALVPGYQALAAELS